MGGNGTWQGNSLGLELTEAVEGDRAALLQRSIPGWAGCEKSAHGWSSRRLRCDETIVPCRLCAEEGRGLRRSWREGEDNPRAARGAEVVRSVCGEGKGLGYFVRAVNAPVFEVQQEFGFCEW